MIIKIFIFFLILSNFILLFYLNKKKIKNFLNVSKIKSVHVTDIHEIFKLNKISKNLKGPKQESIIQSFCISSDNDIVGMTSNYEAWIIASLSKISKNIFEFGTCSGKTTYLMGLNSSNDAKIVTITLNPGEINNISKDKQDSEISFRNIQNESLYEKFLFSSTYIENKIKVIFENSLEFNEKNYKKKIDLIFIDGGHTYSVVKNDTEKSFDMLNEKGIILWHDYVPGKRSSRDIVKYLNEISVTKNIYHIKNTSLCFYKNK
jgi:predicted O-methyltransferase YrrM